MRKYSVYQDYFKLADVVKVKDENEKLTAGENDIMEQAKDIPSGFKTFDPTKLWQSSSTQVNRRKINIIAPEQETKCQPVYGNRMRTAVANMEIHEPHNSSYLLPKSNEGAVVSTSYSAVNKLCELMKTRSVPCRDNTVSMCADDMESRMTSQRVPVVKIREELFSGGHPTYVLTTEQLEPPSPLSVPVPFMPYVYDHRATTFPVTRCASRTTGAHTSGRRTVGMTALQKSALYCQFCKRNGETQQFYKSHVLKDSSGKVQCPVLRSFRCPICNSTGDNAHTITYCPFGSGQPSTMTATRTPKKSCGCPREYANRKNHCHEPVFTGQSTTRHLP